MLLGVHWSDSVGRKKAMLVPSAILVVWAPLFFILAQQQSLPLLWLGIGWGILPRDARRTRGLLDHRTVPHRYRFAGSSLVFQGSSIIAGAPAPLIAVWLVSSFGHEAVVWYLALTMIVTILALATEPETKGKDLHG
jgi:predicted MFS family arabinose efflux permease